MFDKMVVETRVETYLKRLRCPNKTCQGTLEADGKTRNEGGVHGGPIEHRHKCTNCELGIWAKSAYPQVRYSTVVDPQCEGPNVVKKDVR